MKCLINTISYCLLILASSFFSSYRGFSQSILENNEKTIQQEIITVRGKKYKILLEIINNDSSTYSYFANLYLYKKKGSKWLEIHHIKNIQITHFLEYSGILDFDKNKQKDVRLLISVGARQYVHYKFYVINFKREKIQEIKGFSNLNNPSYDTQRKCFIHYTSGPNTEISENIYRIDYNKYELVKIH